MIYLTEPDLQLCAVVYLLKIGAMLPYKRLSSLVHLYLRHAVSTEIVLCEPFVEVVEFISLYKEDSPVASGVSEVSCRRVYDGLRIFCKSRIDWN